MNGEPAEASDSVGATSGADAALPPLQVSNSLLCSPDWADSALHYDCLRQREGSHVQLGADELDGSIFEATADLSIRLQRLRARVQGLWNELLTPALLRETMRQGSCSVSADSVYRLEMHLQELLEFKEVTRQLILDWLERE